MRILPFNKNNIQKSEPGQAAKRLDKLARLFKTLNFNRQNQILQLLTIEIEATNDLHIKNWLIQFKLILEALKTGGTF